MRQLIATIFVSLFIVSFNPSSAQETQPNLKQFYSKLDECELLNAELGRLLEFGTIMNSWAKSDDGVNLLKDLGADIQERLKMINVAKHMVIDPVIEEGGMKAVKPMQQMMATVRRENLINLSKAAGTQSPPVFLNNLMRATKICSTEIKQLMDSANETSETEAGAN